MNKNDEIEKKLSRAAERIGYEFGDDLSEALLPFVLLVEQGSQQRTYSIAGRNGRSLDYLPGASLLAQYKNLLGNIGTKKVGLFMSNFNMDEIQKYYSSKNKRFPPVFSSSVSRNTWDICGGYIEVPFSCTYDSPFLSDIHLIVLGDYNEQFENVHGGTLKFTRYGLSLVRYQIETTTTNNDSNLIERLKPEGESVLDVNPFLLNDLQGENVQRKLIKLDVNDDIAGILQGEYLWNGKWVRNENSE